MVNKWVSLTFAKAFSYTTMGQRAIVTGNLANDDLAKSPSQIDATIAAGDNVTAYVTFRDANAPGKVGYSTLVNLTGARGLKEAIEDLAKLFGEGRDTNDPYVQHLQQFIQQATARVEWVFSDSWLEG